MKYSHPAGSDYICISCVPAVVRLSPYLPCPFLRVPPSLSYCPQALSYDGESLVHRRENPMALKTPSSSTLGSLIQLLFKRAQKQEADLGGSIDVEWK